MNHGQVSFECIHQKVLFQVSETLIEVEYVPALIMRRFWYNMGLEL